MILLGQIILTVVAWNNGWRWLALIPMASAFIIGFIIGMVVGEYNTFAIIADIGSLFAVSIMAMTTFKRGDSTKDVLEDIHKDLSDEN